MATQTYYFNSYDSENSNWSDPANMVDGSTSTYSGAYSGEESNLLDSNSCPGTDLGTIIKVEIRIYGYTESDGGNVPYPIITPVFSGGNGDGHTITDLPDWSSADWSSYADITSDTNAPGDWSWSDVQNMDMYVVADTYVRFEATYIYKAEILITYNEGGETVTGSMSPKSNYWGDL